jgi:hypothetical protein
VISLLNAGNNVRAVPVFQVSAMDAEKVLTMPYILRIDGIEITLAKGKVMNGVKQVCLSGPVITNKTVDLIGKLQGSFAVVLKVSYGKFLQVHLDQGIKV